MTLVERKNIYAEEIRKKINKNHGNKLFIEDIRLIDNKKELINLNKEYCMSFNLCSTETYIDYNYNLRVFYEDIVEDDRMEILINSFFEKLNDVLM